MFKFRQTAPLNYTFAFYFTPSRIFYDEKESDRRETWYAAISSSERGVNRTARRNFQRSLHSIRL